jgi:hypothetical protein
MCDRTNLKKIIIPHLPSILHGALVGVGALWPFGGVLVDAGSC